MSKENPNEFKIINKNERLKYRQTINELKQQLTEKDKLLKCYQDEEKQIADILGDKDLTIIGSRVHLKNLIVELKNKIKDKDIVIEEKDKEIEHLKDAVNMCQNIKRYDIGEMLIENAKLKQNQTQLAIAELEKVKENLKQLEINIDNQAGFSQDYKLELKQKSLYKNVYKIINQQIKELKGE